MKKKRMSIVQLKKEITKNIDQMDHGQLESAFLLVKELVKQKNTPDTINSDLLEEKISRGLRELKEHRGSDFLPFLQEQKLTYGSKKKK